MTRHVIIRISHEVYSLTIQIHYIIQFNSHKRWFSTLENFHSLISDFYSVMHKMCSRTLEAFCSHASRFKIMKARMIFHSRYRIKLY